MTIFASPQDFWVIYCVVGFGAEFLVNGVFIYGVGVQFLEVCSLRVGVLKLFCLGKKQK